MATPVAAGCVACASYVCNVGLLFVRSLRTFLRWMGIGLQSMLKTVLIDENSRQHWSGRGGCRRDGSVACWIGTDQKAIITGNSAWDAQSPSPPPTKHADDIRNKTQQLPHSMPRHVEMGQSIDIRSVHFCVEHQRRHGRTTRGHLLSPPLDSDLWENLLPKIQKMALKFPPPLKFVKTSEAELKF